MAIVCTLDASVFVNAFRPHEDGSDASRRLLAALVEREIPTIEPAILPAEVAGVWARGTGLVRAAREFAASLFALPWLQIAPTTTVVARLAADLAALHRLRGADAFYVATAQRHGALLVTRDREQLHRAAAAVHVCMPEEACRRLE